MCGVLFWCALESPRGTRESGPGWRGGRSLTTPVPGSSFSPTLSHWPPLCNTKPRTDGTPSVGRNCYRGGVDAGIGLMEPFVATWGRGSAVRFDPDLQAALQLEAAEEGVRVGDEGGEDHQQDRGNEHQGDDELDLRRRPGGPFLGPPPRVGAQGHGLLVQLRRER